MHPRARAAREQIARERLVEASKTLAAGLGMSELAEAIASATHKDRDIAVLKRTEAVADFMEALAGSFRVVGPALTEETVLERLEGLELSKTSMTKIRKEFGVEESKDESKENESETEQDEQPGQ